jgi:hypothetical protein
VSRNTVIYRGVVDGRRIVAKAQLTKPASVVVAQFHMLADMLRRLDGSGTRSLRPVAVLEDLGVLVTEEEAGESLRAWIEAGLRGKDEDWTRAVAGVDAAARALRCFHAAYQRPVAVGVSALREVRWYLDYSPKNVLIAAGGADPAVVLMDPPEEERWGSPYEDIGGFCYGMTRIRFLPEFLGDHASRRTIDQLKAWFIRQYHAGDTAPPGAAALGEIEAAEYRHASQALRRYMKPWRYRPVAKEVLRLCYLGPLTALYRHRALRRSYGAVARLLQQGEDGWDQFPVRHGRGWMLSAMR